jgi:hypothetical protein
MTETEKLAVQLANTLLNTPIGHVYPPSYREERIDMTPTCFQQLRKLSEMILDAAAKVCGS